jgi:hypothetical protein
MIAETELGDRFFHIGRLLMSHITVPLILYLAAFSTFYESTPYTLGFNAAFSIIVIMLGGDFRQSIPINEMFQFAFLLEHKRFNVFFLTIAIIDTLAMLTGTVLTPTSARDNKGFIMLPSPEFCIYTNGRDF